MRVSAGSFRERDLVVHKLLEGVPLHDVWVVELAPAPPGKTLRELPGFVPDPNDRDVAWAARLLFRLRLWLGRWMGWDRADSQGDPESYVHQLGAEERRRSLTPPGSAGPGPFHVVYEFEDESLLEVRNATVHAFLSTSLERIADGYRVWLAIFVKPVGRWTAWYMALIDPFRRSIVYPALLRRMRREWSTTNSASSC